ncbi:hypothetical protein [Ktedonobacter racemifer]|uniref:Uncharacterized protein n=1 Tax=Ktedonobacter racemifer DSM 44963 TaxID=485913 RepID=D6TKI8_KTERA|nr:hypothetical protein [Ktedonobacter racemifer]EFH86288.1 hypothetical protein Krac_7580 [Ktedonobacter racemifer DSM 44963]
MARTSVSAQQMSLWMAGEEVAASAETQLVQEVRVVSLPRVRSSHLSLAEMCNLRAWLWQWGKDHEYPELSFPIGNGVLGDRRAGYIGAGQGHWNDVMRCKDMEWVMKAIEWLQTGNFSPSKDGKHE